MKRVIFIMALLFAVLMCRTPTEALTYSLNDYMRDRGYVGSGNYNDPLYNLFQELGDISGTSTTDTGGTVYYVDNNAGSDDNDGKSWDSPFLLISTALAASHADIATSPNYANRNRIYVKGDDFDEDLTKLAQKTDIIGVGSDDGSKMPRLLGEHVIQAAATGYYFMGCRFYNMWFQGQAGDTYVFDIPTSHNGIEFIGCRFMSTANGQAYGIRNTTAHDMKIIGCTFDRAAIGNEGFTTAAIGISTGSIYYLEIIGNNIDSGIGIVINSSTIPTGGIIANNLITASGLTIDDNSDKYYIANNTLISDAAYGELSYDFADTFAVNNVLTCSDATYTIPADDSVTVMVTAAIEADSLDHLAAVSVADEIVNESFLADITTIGSDWSDFVPATDSLQAIGDRITALTGYVHAGTNSAATSTTPVVAALIGYGEDYFNTDWVMVVLLNADSAGAAPEGDVRDITNYVTADGTFTIDATSAALADGDIVMVARKEAFVLAGIKSGTGAYPTGVANDSILAMILSKGAEAAASTYVNSTDSLEMLSDKLGAFAGTAGAAANESLLADMVLLQTDIQTIITDTAAMDDASGMQTLTGTAAVSTTGITGAPTAQTLADTLHKDGSFTFDNTTDSLEAIADEQEYSMTVTRTKGGAIDLVSGTNNLFVVSGPVEVTSLVGIVANTLKAVANDCKFMITTTVPAATADITSAVECTTDAAGTSYICGATFGAALVPTTAGAVASSALKFIAPAGTISWVSAGTYDADDSIVFYIKYKPLISGARVTASP